MNSKPKISMPVIGAILILVMVDFGMSSKLLANPAHNNEINITSVTVNYDNVTSMQLLMPNKTYISRILMTLPSYTQAEYVNASPGSVIKLMVVTTYTFNGQAIEFIPLTPGFTIANYTYLYNNISYTSLQSANVSETQTLIPPGELVGYAVYVKTPQKGYYGNLDIVEVINNVDKSGVLAT